MRPTPDPVQPGQESVWSYPRPPRLERANAHLKVVLGGVTIAETNDAFRVLETSHPPNYYFPPSDVLEGAVAATKGATFCEFKGRARPIGRSPAASASRPKPRGRTRRRARASHRSAITIAFYASRMDACYVDDELVVPQPGGFYGGWITSRVAGPFKGIPGSRGW